MFLEYLAPVILVVGLIGNIINLYVFTRPVFNSKSLSAFRFLAYLSLIDLMYLLIGLSHIMVIVYTGYDFRTYSNFLCSLHSFLTLYLSHVSSNILAGVSVFRCVTITSLKPVKPIPVKNQDTPRGRQKSIFQQLFKSNSSSNKRFLDNFGHADLCVLFIMVLLFFFDCHYLIWMRLSVFDSSVSYLNGTNQLNGTNIILHTICHPSESNQRFYYEFLRNSWIWIDLFLYSYIPFVIMIVCTVLIIYRLFKINRKLKVNLKKRNPVVKLNDSGDINLMLTQSTECRSMATPKPSLAAEAFRKSSRKNSQIYKTLLTLNIFFFVLVTPLVLANSLDLLNESNQIFRDFVYILAYLNHTLNFVFYGFSCKIYRTILIDCFRVGFCCPFSSSKSATNKT